MRDELWQKNAEKKIIREFGAEINALIGDETITEVMLNQDGTIWIDRLYEGMSNTGITMSRERAMLVIGSIAAYEHTTITEKSPLLSASLPGGQRFQAIIEPVTTSPVFSIRCGRAAALQLSDYLPDKMSEDVYHLIQEAILDRQNIIVSGGTTSGKTTLSSAILAEVSKLCPDDRIAVMEETPELQINSKNVVFEKITKDISATTLLAANFRMRPDRIIMGETRGGEALDLLKSWNTGHPGGICTLHANSALEALSRLESMVLESKVPGLTITFIRSLIADAVNLIIHIKKFIKRGPVIAEVLAVEGLNLDGTYRTRVIEKVKVKER